MKIKYLIIAACAFALGGCLNEEPDVPAVSEDCVDVFFGPETIVESGPWTKSKTPVEVLSGSLKGAAIGIYDCYGKLIYSDRVTGTFSSFSSSFRLHKDQKYSCFMVTGYIAGAIVWPDQESDLYTLSIENTSTGSDGQPDLTSTLRDYGPDRSGQITRLTPEAMDALDGKMDGKVCIPIRSLWAKVVVSFNHSALSGVAVSLESGGEQSCGALYGNRVFVPFGSASSLTSGNKFARLPVEKRTAMGGIPSGSFEFYMPENMLGTLLPDNTENDGKTPENVGLLHGASAREAVEKCAVELSSPALADWGDTGRLTYRFCIGDDSTSNFDIQGNTLYSVSLTATPGGYVVKDWKAGLDLTDTRALSLCACVPEAGSGAMGIGESSEVEVAPERTFYLLPSYSQGGSGKTLQSYGTAGGWRLSAQTSTLLAGYGINCSAGQKYVYIKKLTGELFFEDTPYSGNSADVTYYGGSASRVPVLAFTPQDELEEGLALPMTAETADGRHSSTVNVRTRADGSVVLEWVRRPDYIAQKGSVRAASLSGSVSRVAYSLPAEYADILDIQQSGNNLTVRTKASGTAMIKYTGLTAAGTTVCEGYWPLTVKAPILHCSTSLCELPADGASVALTAYYTDESGTRMSSASNDNGGYGQYFTPTGYSSYLSPVLEVGESGASALLSCSGMTAWLARFTSGSVTASSFLGLTIGNAIKIKASGSSSVEPVYCDAAIKAPLGYIGTSRKVCTIDNHCLTGFSSVGTGSVAIGKNQSVTAATGTFTYGASLSSLSIDEYPDLTFALRANGDLAVSGKASPTGYTAGRKILYVNCRNSHSGETLAVPSGYIDIYLHMAPVGVLNLDQSNPRVFSDIEGAEVCPAVANLKSCLATNGYVVRCAFDNGAFYNLGTGMWNYVDEFDSAGNQYSAPDQSSMMTEFHENNWPNALKIGQLAYTIYVGNIEEEEGKYRSAEYFYAYNERPWLRFDYSGLSYLSLSPRNVNFYHFAFGPDYDDSGYSFYILDEPTIPKWKKP